MLVSILPLLLLFGLIVGFAASLRLARSVRRIPPDHHHWVMRVLGAVLCLAAVTAVGIGTWRGTADDLTLPPLMVKVPTKPVPPIQSTTNDQHIDLGPCKLVGTVMLASKEQDRLFPLGGESRVLAWPPAASGELVFQGEYGGMSYSVTMDLREFISWNPGEIRTRNGLSTVMKGFGYSGTSGGTNINLDQITTVPFGQGHEGLWHAPLSVMPLAESPDLCLIVFLTRASCDDPLQEIPAAQWLERQAGKPWQGVSPMQLNSYRGVRYDPNLPPGIRMLSFLGPAAFLLGLAAIAGALVFRRGWRMPAFAGLLALMVLYAGGLDLMVLRRRAALTKDSSQPEAARFHAMAGMVRGTYFHRGAAVERVRAMAADPALPASLREFAGAWSGDFKSP